MVNKKLMVEKNDGFGKFVLDTLRGAFSLENLKEVVAAVREAALFVFYFGQDPPKLSSNQTTHTPGAKEAAAKYARAHEEYMAQSAKIAEQRAAFNAECATRLQVVLDRYADQIKAKIPVEYMQYVSMKEAFGIGNAYWHCDLRIEHKVGGGLIAEIHIPEVSMEGIPMCDLKVYLPHIVNTPDAIVGHLEQGIQSYLAPGK